MPSPTIERSPLRLAIAALSALAIAADLVIHHTAEQRLLGAVLLAVLGVVTVTDLESRRIPNAIVGPAAVVGLGIGAIMHPSGLPGQAVAGVATGAFLMLFAVLSRGGLGMGDVKLGLVLGVFLGRYVVIALVAGLLASGLWGLVLLARHGVARGRKLAIPLGPFLAGGGAVAVLAGRALARHWGGV